MKPVFNHPWDLSEEEAIELQNTLAKRSYKMTNLGINYFVGIDVTYSQRNDTLVAALLLWKIVL
ncbi:MAG TPA: hypothetical protein DCR67_04370 [Brevibacillus sp.]|uniref:Uncharacterized protein n=1 Tax=Brevibacillus laterosporus LMG 15441 TaxID=1042163 RepID=A0A075R235_BRELA|nr:hypothetical protein BRLA_c011460 [Brevibacillus laterosporus LMG 15441]AYK07030.1 hypothetical protein D8Z77_11995 [Brevibacillus laterosporus]HAS00935.1 hypothetical protein [Brevibacillus sp.]